MRAAIIGLLSLVLCRAAGAIVLRDDASVADAEALAARFPASGWLGRQVACVLVAPRWALTAAHTVEEQRAFVDYHVYFGDVRYEVVKIVVHPARERGAVDSSADLALVELDRPVRGVAPVALYPDHDEADQIGTLVGWGGTGTGSTGETGAKVTRARAATNRIEAALQDSLITIFDRPPAATPLEGVGGRGDSGAPLYLERGGRVFVAGIGSFSTGDEKLGTLGKYGVVDAFARVSTRRAWIEEVIAHDAPATVPWGPFVRGGIASLPATPAGALAARLLERWNAGDAAGLARVYVEARGDDTPDKRARVETSMRGLLAAYGRYEVVGARAASPSRLAVLVRPARGAAWRSLDFDLDPDSGRLRRLSMADEEHPRMR